MTEIYFTAPGKGKVLLHGTELVIQLPHEHEAEELADALNETIENWMKEYEARTKKRYGLCGYNSKYLDTNRYFTVSVIDKGVEIPLDSKRLFWDNQRKTHVVYHNNFFYKAKCNTTQELDEWVAVIEESNIIE